MNKQELRQWIIEFAKAPAYPEVIEAIDSRIDSVISEAIAEHEAAQWKEYPDNEPEFGDEYLFIADNGHMFSSKWYGSIALPGQNVIAFRELPKPYQEGGER